MAKLIIRHWKVGFNKIQAVGFIQNATLAGLKNSKDYVDKVLGGETVTIEFDDFKKATALATNLRGIGAEVEIEA